LTFSNKVSKMFLAEVVAPKRCKTNPENSCIVRCKRAIVISSSYSQGFLFGESIMEKHLCECGCGEYARLGNRFIHGHNNKGRRKLESEPKLCECGCGEFVKLGNRFINHHNSKVITEETKAKISKGNRGKKRTKEQKRILSEAHKNPSKEIQRKYAIKAINQMKPRRDGYCDVWSDEEYKNDLRKSACENCGITNMLSIHLFGMKLHTHHKNGKKKCAPDDIQTLCARCHTQLHTLNKPSRRWKNWKNKNGN
jgi:hypothetical protein